MVTAYDVADRAGLSIGTVSRYLTGRGYVSAGAQRRIAKAIEDLGYVRSSAASSLRTRRSGIIGFVLSDLRNPFTAQLATAIQEAAREDGLSVFLANTMGDPDRGVEALENLRKHEIDGLIVTPPGNTDFIAASASLRDSGVPVVSVGLRTRPLRLDLVTVDTEAAARECVEHLIGLGHRRIAYLGNDRRSGRYRGYKKALSTAGIPLVPELVQPIEYSGRPSAQPQYSGSTTPPRSPSSNGLPNGASTFPVTSRSSASTTWRWPVIGSRP
jgi:LacI family transcriptional regulator